MRVGNWRVEGNKTRLQGKVLIVLALNLRNSRLGIRIPKEHFHALEDFSRISMLNEGPENSTIVLRIQGPVSYSQESFSSGFGGPNHDIWPRSPSTYIY